MYVTLCNDYAVLKLNLALGTDKLSACAAFKLAGFSDRSLNAD